MQDQNQEQTPEQTPEVFAESQPAADDGLHVWSMGAALIVALSIQARGGKYYSRQIVDQHVETDGNGVVTMERTDTLTRAVLTAPDERKRAEALCTWARRAIATVCARTVIGLVAPERRRSELAAILAEIRTEVAGFNDASQHCEIVLSTPVYQIAPQDQETIAALSAQLESITAEIAAAIEGDEREAVKAAGSRARGGKTVDAVMAMPPSPERDSVIAHCRASVMRKTISKIQGFDDLLDGEASLAVRDLVSATRAAASELRKRVDKDSETLAAALAATDTSGINLARAAFVAAHRKARVDADADLTSESGGIASPVKRYVRKGVGEGVGEGEGEGETEGETEEPVAAKPATKITPALRPRKVRQVASADGDGDDGDDGGGAKATTAAAPATARNVAKRAGGWRRGKRHTVTDEGNSNSQAGGGSPA